MGLREIKKQKTRKIISDIATQLFMQKGYNEVTMADVAAAAEVSLSTVFNYFPTKETLVFDLEDELDTEILAAIRDRKKGQTILDALYEFFLTSKMINPPNKKIFAEFMKLVRSSPELTTYFRGMLGRYESTLAKEIQVETGVDKLEAQGMARLILEGWSFACNSPARKEALNLMFKVLKKGWDK